MLGAVGWSRISWEKVKHVETLGLDLLLRCFTAIIYLSLLYEIAVIRVPSVASTYQLFFVPPRPFSSSLVARVRRWPLPVKLLLLFLPTAISVVVYMLPLAQAIWPLIGERLHRVQLPLNGAVLAVGTLFCIVGRWAGILAAHRLQETEAPIVGAQALHTSGVFGMTRNPILIGMFMTFFGLWLLFPSWEMAAGFLIFLANMHFRVRLEESFLSEEYGASYEQFLLQTRRYL